MRLRDGRSRRKQNRFLVDGMREVVRAMDSGLVPEEIFVADNDPLPLNELPNEIASRLIQLPPNLFAQLAYGERETGIVGVFPTPVCSLDRLRPVANPIYVVLDRIEKPGNIGAVFRTADAVGATAVLLADCLGDPFNPNAIRASSGAVFSVPSAVASGNEIVAFLKQHNVQILVTRVDATLSHWQCDWNGPVALVIGNEASGIRDAWRTEETTGIRIPMAGIADSLNASITAAICLYEAARIRHSVV